MKILLWAPFGAGTHYWGPGTSAYRLYNSETNKNYKLSLAHGTKKQCDPKQIFAEQIFVSDLGNGNPFNQLRFLYNSKRKIDDLSNQYDVIHGIGFFHFTFYPLCLFEKKSKPTFIKITGEFGGMTESSNLSKILGLNKWRRERINVPTGYIAISNKIKENLLAAGVTEDKIHFLPNGVDMRRFSSISLNEQNNLKEKYRITKDLFTITYIGGITANKRVFQLVKACISLIREKYHLQLILVGPDRSNGVEIQKIKGLIDEAGIRDRIKHFDHTATPEEFHQISDLFVLPSKSEGLSNSLLEAVSCKVPVIATKISGSEDIIEEEVSGIITIGSVVDLKEKIIFAYNNSSKVKFFASNAYNIVKANYDTNLILDRHISLFKRYI